MGKMKDKSVIPFISDDVVHDHFSSNEDDEPYDDSDSMAEYDPHLEQYILDHFKLYIETEKNTEGFFTEEKEIRKLSEDFAKWMKDVYVNEIEAVILESQINRIISTLQHFEFIKPLENNFLMCTINQ